MDPLFEPVKTVLPDGLNLITVRTDRKGLLAGEIRIAFGSSHAAKLNPYWLGLPHFTEHMILSGASRKYAPMEARTLMRDKYFISPNGITSQTFSCYFTTGPEGQVLPARTFWDALAIAADSVYFPRFDPVTMENQRERILEEAAKDLTSLAYDNLRYTQLMYGQEYVGWHPLGTIEQISTYKQEDFFACHQTGYSLKNSTIALAGDIIHAEAVERMSGILAGAPDTKLNLPGLKPLSLQQGEFRRVKDGANEGYLDVDLHFRAPQRADSTFFATQMVVAELNSLMADKVMRKYGLYAAGISYINWATDRPSIQLSLSTGNKSKAADALAYALDTILSPETLKTIIGKRAEIVEHIAAATEVAQPTLQSMATFYSRMNIINAPLESPAQEIARFRSVTSEQIAGVFADLAAAPIFLNVRGHAGALDALPSIEVIDSWRAKPEEASAKLRRGHLAHPSA